MMALPEPEPEPGPEPELEPEPFFFSFNFELCRFIERKVRKAGVLRNYFYVEERKGLKNKRQTKRRGGRRICKT